MTKTPDEIKKALRLCYEGIECEECPYVVECFGDDNEPFGAVMPDALALIQQIQAENKQCHQENTEMYAEMCMLREKVHRLEAERDAAVKDLAYIAFFADGNACDYCDQTDCENGCALADKNIGFKWRGVQKEE